MEEAEWLTPEDVSELIKIPVGTLYQWRYRQKGPPAAKVGRHVRYRRTDVEAWMTSSMTATVT